MDTREPLCAHCRHRLVAGREVAGFSGPDVCGGPVVCVSPESGKKQKLTSPPLLSLRRWSAGLFSGWSNVGVSTHPWTTTQRTFT